MIEGYRGYQLAYPLAHFPAQENAVPGVVSFPDVTANRSRNVQLPSIGIQLDGKDRHRGTISLFDAKDVPGFERALLVR